MTVFLIFFGLTLLLSVASALGWTADSRDHDFTLGRLIGHAYPARPTARGR